MNRSMDTWSNRPIFTGELSPREDSEHRLSSKGWVSEGDAKYSSMGVIVSTVRLGASADSLRLY